MPCRIMPSLDTNCLLRWLLGDVPGHKARMDALMAAGAALEVEDVALIEAVYALERQLRLGRPLIVQSVRALMGSRLLRLI